MKSCNNVWNLFIVNNKDQKQPPRGAPRKRCSENMQKIYSRTPTPKCNFNKVALQIYWNNTSASWVFSYKYAAYFQTPFLKNTSGWLLLKDPFHIKTCFTCCSSNVELEQVNTCWLQYFLKPSEFRDINIKKRYKKWSMLSLRLT